MDTIHTHKIRFVFEDDRCKTQMDVCHFFFFFWFFRLFEVSEGNKSRLGSVQFRPSAVPLSLSWRNGSVEIGDDDNDEEKTKTCCPLRGRRGVELTD